MYVCMYVFASQGIFKHAFAYVPASLKCDLRGRITNSLITSVQTLIVLTDGRTNV